MKRFIVGSAVVALGLGSTVAAFCAPGAVVRQGEYKFKYEVAESPLTKTYKIENTPSGYKNPLKAGFTVKADDSIESVNPNEAPKATKDFAELAGPPDPALKKSLYDVPRPTPTSNITDTDLEATPPVATGFTADKGTTKTYPVPSSPKKVEVINSCHQTEDADEARPYTIYFDLGSSAIKPEILERLTDRTLIVSGGRYKVTAYTCPIGNLAQNERVAQGRAEKVTALVEYLGGEVVEKDARPKCCYVTKNPAELAKNRRVEITPVK